MFSRICTHNVFKIFEWNFIENEDGMEKAMEFSIEILMNWIIYNSIDENEDDM